MVRFLSFFLCFLTFFVKAQYTFLGTAGYMDNGCIQLTPDAPFSEGLAFNTSKLDLNNYFEIQFDLYLGDKDQGADGITFVIHNDVRGFDAFGQWGECMGYGRFDPTRPGNSIDPSIAVEFDTYQNIYQLDPVSDHVAYLENGSSRHKTYWNNDSEAYQLEDNSLHDFRLRWNPSTQTLSVFIDGQTVYTGKKDLINEIFNGEAKVIWGFTASTGRKFNQQYFCLKRLAEQMPMEGSGGNG
ncbi:MAG: hypothetical protein ACJASO_001986 [Cyclobacteriaceae bacterium]|jgi:hypothetical protein